MPPLDSNRRPEDKVHHNGCIDQINHTRLPQTNWFSDTPSIKVFSVITSTHHIHPSCLTIHTTSTTKNISSTFFASILRMSGCLSARPSWISTTSIGGGQRPNYNNWMPVQYSSYRDTQDMSPTSQLLSLRSQRPRRFVIVVAKIVETRSIHHNHWLILHIWIRMVVGQNPLHNITTHERIP